MLRVLPLLLIAVILSGCGSTTPVMVSYPQPPAALMEPPREYRPIPDGTSLRDALPIIVKNNDAGVHNAAHLEMLQEWVREVGSNN